MALARSTILAAVALLLTGSAAKAQLSEQRVDQPAGATLPGAAANVASSSAVLAAKPRSWSIAQRPRYVADGWQCAPGLVWRNAGKTDWLCVDPAEALRIEAENAAAAKDWIEGSEGPQTCRSGLVRREAVSKDFVCVDPERRDAVRQTNAALYTVK